MLLDVPSVNGLPDISALYRDEAQQADCGNASQSDLLPQIEQVTGIVANFLQILR